MFEKEIILKEQRATRGTLASSSVARPENYWPTPALWVIEGLPVAREHHLHIAHELNSAETRVTGLELR
jgi:hypothetical protein